MAYFAQKFDLKKKCPIFKCLIDNLPHGFMKTFFCSKVTSFDVLCAILWKNFGNSKGWAIIAQTDYAQNEGICLGMTAPPGG